MSKNVNKINPGPFGSTVTNFAAVQQSGVALDAGGVGDFTKPKSEAGQIDGGTMFAEGSIGKVRYAGLAYMLQEKGVIDLQEPAGAFFAKDSSRDFLEKKYAPQFGEEIGTKLQDEIAKFFSGDSAKATIADLTTHRAGIGDLTRDLSKTLLPKNGIGHSFEIPELLLIDDPAIPRDSAGKPRAFDPRPEVLEIDLPQAKYGAHQYSNLGYQLLGLALEMAYDSKENKSGLSATKDYKQLTREFLLTPAKEGGMQFGDTKFPEDLQTTDNVARASWLEKEKLVDATQFNGANAAGGIFTSANDSVKFFNEYFRGFPGTAEYGQEGANQFFSEDAIDLMVAEGLKFDECGINKSHDIKRNGNLRYQGPGFGFEVDKESGEPISYEKSGGTFGYQSFLSFNPQLGETTIDMCAQENVSAAIAQKLGLELGDVVGSEGFDRGKLIAENMPEILQGGVAAEVDLGRDEALPPVPALDLATAPPIPPTRGDDSPSPSTEIDAAIQAARDAIANNDPARAGAFETSDPKVSSAEFNLANGGRQVTRTESSGRN